MSLKELRSRIDIYESLFDRLYAASDFERSNLLSAYAQDKRSRNDEGPPLGRQVEETNKSSTHLKNNDGGSQGETLTVLGCGTLGAAILSGIVSSLNSSSPPKPSEDSQSPAQTPSKFIACVTRPSSVKRLESTLQSMTSSLTVLQNQNLKGVQSASNIVLACKPKDLSSVLHEDGIREALAGKLLISILAGVPVSQIEETLYGRTNSKSSEQEGRCRIVRVMPNTASVNGESMTVVALSTPPLARSQADLVSWMFTRIGRVVQLPASAMDASTALCGSGPAFCALMLEAMADGAVAMGIPRAEAQEMAAQTMRGSTGMVLGGEHPALVRDKVSTPGGCTIGGLLVLEEGSLRGTIARGVREATVVASQLGRGVQNVNGTWGR